MARGRHSLETKAKAVAAMLTHPSLKEAADAAGVGRDTLWRWIRTDAEFQQLRAQALKQLVDHAVMQLKALAPLVVEAFEKGLRSNTRYVLTRDGKKVGLPDYSLAVRSAEAVAHLLEEFLPHTSVDVNVEATEQLAAIVRRLDGNGAPAE